MQHVFKAVANGLILLQEVIVLAKPSSIMPTFNVLISMKREILLFSCYLNKLDILYQ